MASLLSALARVVDDARATAAAALAAPPALTVVEEVGASRQGRLIHGDNLAALAALVAEKPAGAADFIYFDPPFASASDYRRVVELADDPAPLLVSQLTYRDRWPGGVPEYLAMLAPRIVAAHAALSPTGVLCVHLDWHVAHLVRVILDEVFGAERLVNEVVWRYGKMSNPRRRLPQNHDTIAVYSRGEGYPFTPISGGPSEYRARFERYLTGNRVLYGTVAGSRDKLITRRVAARERSLGRPLQADDVLFDFDTEFKVQDDVFTDISIVKGNARENRRFDTQKPVRLLTRLMEAFSTEDAVVLDPFVGSGTSALAAQALGRRWIGVDAAAPSIEVVGERLADAPGAGWTFETVGQREEPTESVTVSAVRDPDGPVGPDGIEVQLQGYRLEAAGLALSEPDRERVRGLVARDPLAAVARWSVDPAYDGVTFRGRWTAARGPGLRVPDRARLRAAAGPVAVRVHDVFGGVGQTVLEAPKPR